MGDNRYHFQQELVALETRTLSCIDMLVGLLDRAVDALAHHDAEPATVVVLDRTRIDARCLDLQRALVRLLACQSPVAGDLRLVAALLHVIKHCERIGDQCASIATMVLLLGHDPPIDTEMAARIEAMGARARAQVRQARRSFALRDGMLAGDLADQDDTLDNLNREVFRRAVDVGGADARLREWASAMVLVARALERIGDNAVDIGEQALFVVTGRFREPVS